MTKRDIKSIGWAAAIAAGLAGAIYWFGVRRKTIAELSPVQINWEGQ